MSSIAANASPERTTRWLLIGAVAAAIITGVLVFAAVANFSSSDGGSASGAGDAEVLVAKDTIGAGSQLEADMFRVATFAEEDLVPSALSNPDAIVGQTVTQEILKGQQLSRFHLAATSNDGRAEQLAFKILAEEGGRAVSISVDRVTGVSGLLVPGDRVDVVARFREQASNDPDAQKFIRVSTILQNKLVAARETLEVERIGNLPGEETTNEEDQPSITGDEFGRRPEDAEAETSLSVVTLNLTPAEIQQLLLFDELGEIWLSLRQFGDDEIREIDDFVVPVYD